MTEPRILRDITLGVLFIVFSLFFFWISWWFTGFIPIWDWVISFYTALFSRFVFNIGYYMIRGIEDVDIS